MQGKKADIEGLLAEGRIIQIKPEGYSMYPLFVPGRDEALIAPADVESLRRGDVVLYRREGSILVLHRIWKRKGNEFYLVGDNQHEIEGPLGSEHVKGVLVGMIRNGKKLSLRNPVYRLYSGTWLLLRPFRPLLSRAAARCKKVLLRDAHTKGG